MKKAVLVLVSALLSACSMIPDHDQQPTSQVAVISSPGFNHYSPSIRHAAPQADLASYTQQLMQSMINNLKQVNEQSRFALATFVYLDGDLRQSDLLGMQLAESMLYQLHDFGANVVDVKVTEFVRVTAQGDFIFSRDFSDLSLDVGFDYVLGGTLVNRSNGVLVNARIIDLRSKLVVSSAQITLPHEVVEDLVFSQWQDGIPGVAKQ